MLSPPLVFYQTIPEYRLHYEKNYCRREIITFDGIRVYFKPTKFGHVFYESSERDGKKNVFSKIRAERIDWIKPTLESKEAKLYQGWNKKDKIYDVRRRVSVVYESFIVVIEINHNESNGNPIKAEFITAYVADSSIDKIMNSPKWSNRQTN